MKYLLLALCLGFASCMPRTSVLKIYYFGEAPVQNADVAPMEQQIDAAAMAACVLAGMDPHKVFEKNVFLVGFVRGPISYDGKLYAGLSENETSRVMFTPKCLFDPQSALLHEFLHQMFRVQHGGDMDDEHTNARWRIIPALNQALAEHYCPEQFPPFMPNPGETFP